MSVCATCRNPLTLAIDDDDEDGSAASGRTVPDDVELNCGCHYHWYEYFLPGAAGVHPGPNYSEACRLISIVHQAMSLGCIYHYAMPRLRKNRCQLHVYR